MEKELTTTAPAMPESLIVVQQLPIIKAAAQHQGAGAAVGG